MKDTLSLYTCTLLLVIGGVTQCLAVKVITVLEGASLSLSCPLQNHNESDHLEWRNPKGFLIFFNKHRALKDMRAKVFSLTKKEYTIHINDVTFRDGGIYKCLQYSSPVRTKRYKVIVLSVPILEKAEHESKTIIKCSASANGHPPRLSWLLESGLEIEAYPNYTWENVSKKYTTVSVLHVKSHKRKATLKCQVQHPALHGSTLIDFIDIENPDSSDYFSDTTESTEKVVIPTSTPMLTSAIYTNRQSEKTEAKTSATTYEQKNVTSTTSFNNINENYTIDSNLETTGDNDGSVSTINNQGVKNGDISKQSGEDTNSPLLVLLVICLVICLGIVLIFFMLRLRKAHIAWKKENEESNQSVESSKSKSSNEEKQKQTPELRGRGIWNTNFAKYNVEEAMERETTPTPTPTIEVLRETTENPNHNIRPCIKETEL